MCNICQIRHERWMADQAGSTSSVWMSGEVKMQEADFDRFLINLFPTSRFCRISIILFIHKTPLGSIEVFWVIYILYRFIECKRCVIWCVLLEGVRHFQRNDLVENSKYIRHHFKHPKGLLWERPLFPKRDWWTFIGRHPLVQNAPNEYSMLVPL